MCESRAFRGSSSLGHLLSCCKAEQMPPLMEGGIKERLGSFEGGLGTARAENHESLFLPGGQVTTQPPSGENPLLPDKLQGSHSLPPAGPQLDAT